MLLLSIRRQSGTMVDEISAFGGDCLHRGSMLQLSIARPFCMTPPYWSSLSSNNTNTYCSIVLNIQTFGVILNHDDGIATRHRNNMHCKILQYCYLCNMILQYENILQYHIAIFWYFAILIAILAIYCNILCNTVLVKITTKPLLICGLNPLDLYASQKIGQKNKKIALLVAFSDVKLKISSKICSSRGFKPRNKH